MADIPFPKEGETVLCNRSKECAAILKSSDGTQITCDHKTPHAHMGYPFSGCCWGDCFFIYAEDQLRWCVSHKEEKKCEPSTSS